MEQFGAVTLHCGDCLEVLGGLAENSIDSCVTDPPYHLTSIVKRFGAENAAPVKSNLVRDPDTLQPITGGQSTSQYGRLSTGFMGKQWDGGDVAFRPETWAAVYRVLKPGAHLLAFGGTRTFHRMAVAIENAGFEIRDTIMWVYGSGFPKSHNVSKGIDRAAGVEREKVRSPMGPTGNKYCKGLGDGRPWMEAAADVGYHEHDGDEPATDAARQWEGWGTALKPCHEDLVLARKPLQNGWLITTLARRLMEGLCQLPSLASAAGSNSALSRSVFGTDAEHVSVQWNAALKCNTPAALFDLMDTWPSGLAIPSSLSIALSWLAILEECSALESMFTTETASSLTIDLKTLNCLLSKNIADTIIGVAIPTNGTASSALAVASIFSAVAARLKSTRTLSVLGNASDEIATDCPVEDASFVPNCEPIVLARKPLSEKTVAANVLKWGTGAINVDGCRVGTNKNVPASASTKSPMMSALGGGEGATPGAANGSGFDPNIGRWPANLIHDGSEEVVGAFPESGPSKAAPRGSVQRFDPASDETKRPKGGNDVRGVNDDGGSAARFFASCGFSDIDRQWQDQNPQTEHAKNAGECAKRFIYCAKANKRERIGSKHPTVKPIKLLRYLVRLITPPGGTVLDCFAGTGTTGAAAIAEGFRAVLIEREEEYQADIRRRLGTPPPPLATQEPEKSRKIYGQFNGDAYRAADAENDRKQFSMF